MAISITARDRPYAMAQVRGRVTERLDDEAAWTIIDRISQKYTGRPYPPRTIVEVARLNQDDIVEVEGTFYVPKK